MAQIKSYGLLRHLRSDATSHIQYFHKGRRVRSGRGLAFWFLPDDASVSEVPLDDRELPFLLKGQSADFQDLAVQGEILWRVAEPELLAERIDFALDLSSGFHKGQPVDQIDNLLISLIRRFTVMHLTGRGIRDLLAEGIAPLQEAVMAGVTGDERLDAMGLEIINVSVAEVAPSSELARALQAPTYEELQQKADEASFARRALAVEKERAIAENELGNKIELASRQKELIAREDANTRAQAEAKAAALKIGAAAEAERIRTVGRARSEMEGAKLRLYAELSPAVLPAMAAQDFAGKLERVDNLTVTPDMLAGLLGQVKGVLSSRAQLPATQEPGAGK